MDRSYFEKLIRKYVEGQATPTETFLVDSWYETLESDQQAESAEEAEGNHSRFKQELLDKTTNKLHHAKLRRLQRIQRISAAALVLIAVGLSWLLWPDIRTTSGEFSSLNPFKDKQPEAVQFSTAGKQVKKLTLPDSSVVFMNANSTLHLAPGFGKTNRQMTLSGEAYFEVRKDPTRAFVVQADRLSVSVLGTSFNVQAYEGMDQVRVAVATGKVAISDGRTGVQLTHGEQTAYQKSENLFYSKSASTFGIGSWKDGSVHLNDARFEELARSIYNLYGVWLTSEHQHVRDDRYNFTVRSTRTLEETLTQLTTIMHTQYRKEGDTIIIK